MINSMEAARNLESYIIEQRHWFHSHPELSWQEFGTTRHIAEELRAMGIEPQFFDGDTTGLYAFIHGGKTGARGRTIMLRADIDALPVLEKSGAPYSSTTDGVMHACGHDCHMAMLLGAAKILKENEEELEGSVKLLFQGAEETAIGAKRYVEQGVLEGVDAVYGCHVNINYPAGQIKLLPEKCMPSADSFTIRIHGVSTHGAMPQHGKDAVVAAAAVVMNLQTLVSRGNDPLNPLVISIGTIAGGKEYNIISNEVTMRGTVRTFDPAVRSRIADDMQHIISLTAQTFGCTGELDYEWKTGPVLHTDERMNALVRSAAEKVYGEGQIARETHGTFSDDFAFFSERRPAFYAMIGVRSEKLGCVYPHHHECFNVDESALKLGTAMFVQVTEDYLSEERA